MMTPDENNIPTGNKILVAENNEANLSMLLDMLSIMNLRSLLREMVKKPLSWLWPINQN